jgi:hypothetical protein
MRLVTQAAKFLVVAASLNCQGCKSVDRFDTGPNGAFCGELIGGVASEGLIPDGSSDKLQLGLTLDSKHLGDYPGTLWSDDVANDAGANRQGDGLCPGQPLFNKASVRTIQKALYDVIASVQITPDHDQDIFTWVDSTCQGTFVSILSLMNDGRVEVRLFKPKPATDAGAPASERSGFGVFSLTRHDTGCGF